MILTEVLILEIFNLRRRLMIETNASNYIIGETLFQKKEEERETLRFYLRKINSAKQNYIIEKKEILAMIKTIKKQRKYVKYIREKVKIITDYKNLIYFQKTRIINRRQVRQALEL